MNKEILIKDCKSCQFFQVNMDGMYCSHPYWKDKPAYEDMIINQNNCRGTFPEKCPLRTENLSITYKLDL